MKPKLYGYKKSDQRYEFHHYLTLDHFIQAFLT
jgi:hypothetical protein